MWGGMGELVIGDWFTGDWSNWQILLGLRRHGNVGSFTRYNHAVMKSPIAFCLHRLKSVSGIQNPLKRVRRATRFNGFLLSGFSLSPLLLFTLLLSSSTPALAGVRSVKVKALTLPLHWSEPVVGVELMNAHLVCGYSSGAILFPSYRSKVLALETRFVVTGANTAETALKPGTHKLTVQAGDDQHRTMEGLCETITVTVK